MMTTLGTAQLLMLCLCFIKWISEKNILIVGITIERNWIRSSNNNWKKLKKHLPVVEKFRVFPVFLSIFKSLAFSRLYRFCGHPACFWKFPSSFWNFFEVSGKFFEISENLPEVYGSFPKFYRNFPKFSVTSYEGSENFPKTSGNSPEISQTHSKACEIFPEF